jgi:hypothetical protein
VGLRTSRALGGFLHAAPLIALLQKEVRRNADDFFAAPRSAARLSNPARLREFGGPCISFEKR